jgi:hypothetical protein
MVPRRPKYNPHPKYNPFLFRSKSYLFSLNAIMTSYIFASLSVYFKRADRNVFKLAHTCYCEPTYLRMTSGEGEAYQGHSTIESPGVTGRAH